MNEDNLTALGFVRTQQDEPEEDYWMLEFNGAATDLLAELDPDGWRLSRSPRDGEPKGQWIDIAEDLDETALIAAIEAELAPTAG